MNLGNLLESLVGSTLSSRPKRHLGVGRFLTGGGGSGGRSFLNASNLLTAAALGWAGYEIYKSSRGNAAGSAATLGGSPSFGGPASTLDAPTIGRGASTLSAPSVGRSHASDVPPIPTSSAAGATPVESGAEPDGLKRTVALVLAAAKCDGALSATEYSKILAEAKSVGAEQLVFEELSKPRALASLVANVKDEGLRRDLYVLAYAVVRADEGVHTTERAWLERLAAMLNLNADTAARLEKDTNARIAAET